MIKVKLQQILAKVQQNSSCHQKYLKILENHYNQSPFDEFCKHFVSCLELVFSQDMTGRNPYIERCLDFCAKFCVHLARQSEKDDETHSDISDTPHPFLSKIIQETLEYHDLELVQARYHSCKFIMLLLQNIGNDTHLDNDICDTIQEAMLERMLDPKPPIRLQAITALVRLQEPLNPDCPVIKAYLLCFNDASAAVRKEVVRMIAPNALTIPKIKERVRDVDYSVRLAAFGRCADIGPNLFKIVDRQSILTSGFGETNKLARQVFLENLIPKWLTAYNGDFLQFLSAIKLDADEEDIQKTTEISAKLMEVFFRSNPIKDIINALPVEDKLVPLEKLSTEVVTYWCITTNHLRNSDDPGEFLDMILPELTHFSNYIDRVLKHRSMRKMDEWEFLDFQNILLNIFEMAEKYDFSDEVGRKTLNSLIMSVLQNYKFSMKLISKLVRISEKLSSSIDGFTQDICQIISDIREPLVDEQPSVEQTRKRDFQLAEVNVKIDILNQDKDDAIEKQDFQKAAEIQKELVVLRKKRDEINKHFEGEKVKVTKDDPDTVCRCLDILIGILQLPAIKTMSDTLRTCKDEFVMPLLGNNISEIHWRVLKCLTLFCIIDKATAEESAKILCIPIAMYRAIPNYDKSTLIVAVQAVSDLVRLYSASLLCPDESETHSSVNQSTRRRLYRNEDMDESTTISQNKMNVEFIIEIILDMLDDENDEIRHVAVEAVAKLIMYSLPVSPFLISRMILKWYSPLTEKQDVKLQQKLGVVIHRFTETVDGAKEIVEKSVIPILTSIANAPKTSPLADIDVDNVLRFLAAITNSGGASGIVNVHQNLAHSLCNKIASKPHDSCVPYLAKMLLYLEIPVEDDTAINELIKQAELLTEEVFDKAPKRNITKFIANLKEKMGTPSTNNEQNTVNTSNENTNVNNTDNLDNADSTSSFTIEDDTSSASSGKEIRKDVPLKCVEKPVEKSTFNGAVNVLEKIVEEELDNDKNPVSEKIRIISNVTIQNNALVADKKIGSTSGVPNNTNKDTNNKIQKEPTNSNENIQHLCSEKVAVGEDINPSLNNQLKNVQNNEIVRNTQSDEEEQLDDDKIADEKKTSNHNKVDNDKIANKKTINNNNNKVVKKSPTGKNSESDRITLKPRTRAMSNSEKISTRLRYKKRLSVLVSPLGSPNSSVTRRSQGKTKHKYDSSSETANDTSFSSSSTTGSRGRRKGSESPTESHSCTPPSKTGRGKSQDTPRTFAKKQIVVVNIKSKDNIASKKRVIERRNGESANIGKVLRMKQVRAVEEMVSQEKAKESSKTALDKKKSSILSGHLSSPVTRGKKIDFEKLLNLSPRNRNNTSKNSTNLSAVPIAESTRNHTRNSLNSSNEENSNLLSNLNSSCQVKRKKHRSSSGKKDSSYDDATVLHTIVEQSLDVPSLLEDSSPFSTPSNKSSKNVSPLDRRKKQRNVIIANTSSDSELSSSSGTVRRSARKLKKKKLGDYV